MRVVDRPADRKKAEYGALAAYEAIGHGTGSHLFIWVDSPMAGVIASTYVGFALEEPLKPKLMKPWADEMMEGQFSAGMMAQLDALNLVNGPDLAPFKGLQRIAQNTCWWWAFDVGVVFCERPAKVSVNGSRVTMEFRDGWRVG